MTMHYLSLYIIFFFPLYYFIFSLLFSIPFFQFPFFLCLYISSSSVVDSPTQQHHQRHCINRRLRISPSCFNSRYFFGYTLHCLCFCPLLPFLSFSSFCVSSRRGTLSPLSHQESRSKNQDTRFKNEEIEIVRPTHPSRTSISR